MEYAKRVLNIHVEGALARPSKLKLYSRWVKLISQLEVLFGLLVYAALEIKLIFLAGLNHHDFTISTFLLLLGDEALNLSLDLRLVLHQNSLLFGFVILPTRASGIWVFGVDKREVNF